MPRKYEKSFKSMVVNLVVNEKHSTIKTAKQFNIPLKTLEKWITAYNKDNNIFNPDYKSQAQIINELKKEKAALQKENDILRKAISFLSNQK